MRRGGRRRCARRWARSFRDQVRDLFMRAVEHGVTAGELAELDDRQGPDGTPGLWRAAGRLMREYEQVTALSSQAAVDAAWVVAAAADLLVVDDEVAEAAAGPLRLVLVDDAQELTAGTLALVDALARRTPRARWVLSGDPDAAVQGFRGARPGAFLEWARDDVPEVLPCSHRHGPVLRAVAGRVAERIGAHGVEHRRPVPRAAGEGPGGSGAVPEEAGGGPAAGESVRPEEAAALVFPSVHAELSHVSTVLRREHVLAGVPWGRMAVVARGRGRTEQVRRAWSGPGCRCRSPAGGSRSRGNPWSRRCLTSWSPRSSSRGCAPVGSPGRAPDRTRSPGPVPPRWTGPRWPWRMLPVRPPWWTRSASPAG
ncbi:hypothetical protein BJF82_03010 [Kytococcus sp. CUA-901]|nr:hypothetical protein BJF82_03010 [Kytococcus sp. CUA-901]